MTRAEAAGLQCVLNVTLDMITGTITSDDYLAAQRLHRRTAAKMYVAISISFLVLGVALDFLLDSSIGYILVGAGLGGWIGEIVTSRVYMPWKVRKLHRQQKDLSEPFTYTWDADYLEGRSASGQARRKWDAYHKFKENEHLMLLYHADNIFEMFPKAWFGDASTLDRFRELASIANKANKTTAADAH